MFVRKNDRVGLIVAQNLQAASIFNLYGLDFYSKGERTLEHACLEDNVPMTSILEELWDLNGTCENSRDFLNMDLMDLSVYILQKHHKFAEQKVIFIKHTLDRLVYEGNDPGHNVNKIRKTFHDLSVYLTVHMKHEEFFIFPFIQKMVTTKSTKFLKMTNLHHPIAAMEADHRNEVHTLKTLAELTNNYVVPSNADYALRISYGALKELEDDLKIHMHLENNILFPKAINIAYTINQNLN